jgi:hypothetical protein
MTNTEIKLQQCDNDIKKLTEERERLRKQVKDEKAPEVRVGDVFDIRYEVGRDRLRLVMQEWPPGSGNLVALDWRGNRVASSVESIRSNLAHGLYRKLYNVFDR